MVPCRPYFFNLFNSLFAYSFLFWPGFVEMMMPKSVQCFALAIAPPRWRSILSFKKVIFLMFSSIVSKAMTFFFVASATPNGWNWPSPMNMNVSTEAWMLFAAEKLQPNTWPLCLIRSSPSPICTLNPSELINELMLSK